MPENDPWMFAVLLEISKGDAFMSRCPKSLLVLVMAAYGIFLACSPKMVIPSASDFTGESGGCGSFFVYRFNNAKTLALTVFVDEKAISLAEGPTEIEVDPTTKGVAIGVLQFRKPAIDYFCDDVGGDPPPVFEWHAVAGKITVNRIGGIPPSGLGNATHRVSVVLANVQLKNGKTGETATLDEAWIGDIWVGWLAS